MNTPLKTILATSGLFGFALSILSMTLLFNSSASAAEDDASGLVIAKDAIQMDVYKSPSCRCCTKWVKHLEGDNILVSVKNSKNLSPIKARYGIEQPYRSCHTAVADGYAFEGHIPVSIIRKFLAEKPKDVFGLAVPGMPIGSPGMEIGNRAQDYDVLLLKNDGSTQVYVHIARDEKAQK